MVLVPLGGHNDRVRAANVMDDIIDAATSRPNRPTSVDGSGLIVRDFLISVKRVLLDVAFGSLSRLLFKSCNIYEHTYK